MGGLRAELSHLLHNSLAFTTSKAYAKHFLYLVRFLVLVGWLPRLKDVAFMRNHGLPMYCAFLCRTCSGDTVKTYLHGIRYAYLSLGLANPLAGNFRVKQIIKAQQRARPSGTNRKMPITFDMLKVLVACSDINNPFHVACICASLVAFFAFLRKSNVSVKLNDVWQAHSLSRLDVRLDYPRQLLWVTLHMTKTRGHTVVKPLRIPIPSIPGHPLDPVQWWIRHLFLSPMSPGEHPVAVHAFAYARAPSNVQGLPLTPLSHSAFRAFLRQKLSQGIPGLQVSKYSHQSFRRGGATFAFSCNLPSVFIKAMGDWLSDSYMRYIELDDSIRASVAHRFSRAILAMR